MTTKNDMPPLSRFTPRDAGRALGIPAKETPTPSGSKGTGNPYLNAYQEDAEALLEAAVMTARAFAVDRDCRNYSDDALLAAAMQAYIHRARADLAPHIRDACEYMEGAAESLEKLANNYGSEA